LLLFDHFVFFACYNDWIYDEASSYNGVLNNTVWELLTYSKFKLANSHVINSLYFRLLQHGHFTDVIYYRMLGLVGFVLFFIANLRILKLLKINNLYLIFLIVAPYFFLLYLWPGLRFGNRQLCHVFALFAEV